MHYQQLLELADLVGLTRAIIARHFGLSGVQVTRWATGTRPVPRKYRQPLWEMIQDAAEAFLASGKADVWPDAAQGQSHLGRLLGSGEVAPLRRTIEARMADMATVTNEQRGQGLTAWITSTCAALDAYCTMPPHELRTPASTARLRELALRLVVLSDELARLAPQMDDTEAPGENQARREKRARQKAAHPHTI